MPENRAVLIFVSGSQKGERVSLPGGVLVAGRSASANILLAEQYVSREQMRFQFTPDGWIVECLSNRRIRINGKKFKAGQRILLDTGDVIGAGMSTEMLFVAPGDDATVALDTYLDHAGDEALRAAEVLPAVVLGEEGELVEAVEAPPTANLEEVAESDDDEEDLTDEEKEELARQKKIRKYMILGAIYAVVIIGFVVVLKWVRPPETNTASGVKVMSDREIEEVLLAKVEVGRPSESEANSFIAKARGFWDAREVEAGNLYKCVKCFRYAIAYSPTGVLNRPENANLFTEAKDRLVKTVTEAYSNAVIEANSRSYTRAVREFERILRLVPAKDDPNPEQFNKLWDNVVDHIEVLRGKLNEHGGGVKGPFGS